MPITSTKGLVAAVMATMLACAARAELPESTLLTGDLIILRGAGDKFVPLLQREGAAPKFAPPRTKFKVINDAPDGNPRTLTLVVKDMPCAQGDVSTMALVAQKVSSIHVAKEDCAEADKVVEGHNYTIAKSALDNFGYRRMGWIYGGLLIPYKYFRHDKSLEPGTTLGPFFGYRLGQTGWGVSLIGTYAVTTVKVRVVDGAELKERSFTGVSRGVGLMFDVAKSADPFRIGMMWGRDRVGSNNVDVYPHDGRSWFALQIGWEFGR